MNEWEKQYIQSNLVSLVDEIDSSKILTYLLQSNIISRSERVELDTDLANKGNLVQTSHLLDIIRIKINGYQELVKALYITKQTGPMLTLLYGVQINTLTNPFQYCGIELNLDKILPCQVNFEGCQITFADILRQLPGHGINALRKHIDVPIYKCLTAKKEIIVAKETTPAVIPYYIKRTLTLQIKLDKQIFADQHEDIFLVENIEVHQLTRLAQMSKTARPSSSFPRYDDVHSMSTGISSEQISELTTKLILLENEQHFDAICNRAKDKRVHHLKFCDDCYFLERSTNPHDIKGYILDEEIQIHENDFLSSVSSFKPVIIYDTPGMGKSVVLANLARQVKLQQPTNYVIFFEMREIVDKVLVKMSDIDIQLIEDVLLDTISINKFGRYINRELLNRPRNLTHIFLDAFDEVNSDYLNVAINIIRVVCAHKDKYKIYITARPHHKDDLEKLCGVVGYGIHPFKTEEQIAFLVEYWQKQYNVETSNEITEFAKNCLKVFRGKVSSKEREITGIPLQCKMLADVYSKHAQDRSYSLKNSKIAMNTIYDMYRAFFILKFPGTELKLGKNSVLDFHFKLSFDLLFPSVSKNIYNWPDLQGQNELFSIGIIEMGKSGNEQFVHRTFAEFLIAEFITNLIEIGHGSKIDMENFIQFLLFDALKYVNFDLSLNFHSPFSEDFNVICLWHATKFKFPVLTFFLGHSISVNKLEHKMPNLLNISEEASNLLSSKKCEDMLMASIENNSIGLFTFFANLPDKYFFDIRDKSVDLKLERQNKNKQEIVKFKLSRPSFHLIVSTFLCSLDLLKLSFAFISSLTKSPISSLKYSAEIQTNLVNLHPLLVSAQRGNYHIFVFVFENFTERNVDFDEILYNCVHNSYLDSPSSVEDKIQMIKLLLTMPGITLNINMSAVSLFMCDKIHVDLILFCFNQDVDALSTDGYGNTLAHYVPSYVTANEYHKFVKWLVENELSSIFKVRNHGNETAVHSALYRLEIKLDTLKILAKQCSVTFNEKDYYGSALVSAINGGRSVSVLQTLVELGANIETRNRNRCTVLCCAIEQNNFEALEYFLSLGVDPNIRCNYFVSNIWEHLLKQKDNLESSVLSDTVSMLVKHGADINSATNINKIDFEDLSTVVYRPASVKLRDLNLKHECFNNLNNTCTGGSSFTSRVCTFCCCMAFCCHWSYSCCCCGIKPCSSKK